jgi:hypothetical protein
LDLPVQNRLLVVVVRLNRGLPRFKDGRRIGEIAMQFNDSA